MATAYICLVLSTTPTALHLKELSDRTGVPAMQIKSRTESGVPAFHFDLYDDDYAHLKKSMLDALDYLDAVGLPYYLAETGGDPLDPSADLANDPMPRDIAMNVFESFDEIARQDSDQNRP